MKFHPLAITFAPAVVVILIIFPAVSAQRPSNDAGAKLSEPLSVKADLYPADADARSEIDEALKRATAERKRVLLIFGANWCYDCHVLDQALHDGDAGKIVRQNFLLVHVDIGEGEKNPDLLKTYKIPLDKGVPAVAVLENNGRLLYSSGDGEFEAARRMLKKDLVAFLNKWKQLRS
jgi:thiol:disulfide interchange protein